MKQIKELIEHIGNDWIALNDGQEIKIVKKYAKSGQKYIYGFAGRKNRIKRYN